MNAPRRPHAVSAALFSSMKNVEINGGVLGGEGGGEGRGGGEGARAECALQTADSKGAKIALLKPSLADYASTLS